jgi:hypothetical protein
MLRGGGGFAPFLSLCGVTVVLGAALLLLLGRNGGAAQSGE